MLRRATFRKACDCQSDSGTNRFVVENQIVGYALVRTITFYPMPSCCLCNKPWIEVRATLREGDEIALVHSTPPSSVFTDFMRQIMRQCLERPAPHP